METRNKAISLIAAILFVVVGAVAGVIAIGWAPMAIISSAGAIALVLWLKTTFKNPAEPREILPLFLMTVAGLIVHLAEEYFAGFAPAMSRLFEIEFSERRFLIVFVFAGPFLYQWIAFGLFYRNRFANFMAWFIFVGPGFLEFMHFVFPLIEGGPYHYFPGMYTAILPMLPGCYALYRFLREPDA